MLRLLATPPWLLRSAVALVVAAGLARLGLWQARRARASDGSSTNWAYAAEWWSFSLLVLVGLWWWARETRDRQEGRTGDERPVPDAPPLPTTQPPPSPAREDV